MKLFLIGLFLVIPFIHICAKTHTNSASFYPYSYTAKKIRQPHSSQSKVASSASPTHTPQPPDPHVLKLALTAYNCAVLEGQDKRQLLTIVDYSKPSSEKRLWVIDPATKKILLNSLVAHGKGSGNVVPNYFSNQPQTHASSLGLFLTGNTYEGHNGYSLRLYGLEKNYNGNAAAREIVVHGANYVNDFLAAGSGRIGRSWGCPAVPENLAVPLINTIKGGSILFAYYPDKNWLQQSAYLHCAIPSNSLGAAGVSHLRA